LIRGIEREQWPRTTTKPSRMIRAAPALELELATILTQFHVKHSPHDSGNCCSARCITTHGSAGAGRRRVDRHCAA
jgi:hypothetical protein